MKIQLDTENKTIKLESEVKLSKLIETLKKLLPNNEWKSFTLQTNTIINNWNSPIVIRETYPVLPRYPYWQPWYTTTHYAHSLNKTNVNYSSANNTSGLMNKLGEGLQLKSGVFNVEI